MSPLFSVFGIFNYLFKCDWMHCADQGITQDFLGHLFAYLVEYKMPGDTEEIRCKAMSGHIETYYDAYGVEDRLKQFVPKTYAKESKKTPPRLKGNAATTRALVPFGGLMAQQFLSDTDPIEMAMKQAAHHLCNCYNSLHFRNEAFSHAALHNSAKQFAIQFGALWAAHGHDVLWRPKPKMHLFLELCSAATEPQKFWNYRDEDFGGTISRTCRMKGMWKKIGAFCKHGLDMFRMKNDAPRIVEAE